ncbi:MAG: hypothetical protein WBH50_22510, partial [Fuerstiella sp.]
MLDSKDGWLAQVAKENNIAFQSKSPTQADRATDARKKAAMDSAMGKLRSQIKAAQADLAKLQKDPTANARQIAKRESQIKSVKARLKSMAEPAVAEQASGGGSIDVAKAIQDAYLRTLSRMPTESETETATTFIAEAEDQLDGLRGVMWALLNTKEFIVNH